MACPCGLKLAGGRRKRTVRKNKGLRQKGGNANKANNKMSNNNSIKNRSNNNSNSVSNPASVNNSNNNSNSVFDKVIYDIEVYADKAINALENHDEKNVILYTGKLFEAKRRFYNDFMVGENEDDNLDAAEDHVAKILMDVQDAIEKYEDEFPNNNSHLSQYNLAPTRKSRKTRKGRKSRK